MFNLTSATMYGTEEKASSTTDRLPPCFPRTTFNTPSGPVSSACIHMLTRGVAHALRIPRALRPISLLYHITPLRALLPSRYPTRQYRENHSNDQESPIVPLLFLCRRIHLHPRQRPLPPTKTMTPATATQTSDLRNGRAACRYRALPAPLKKFRARILIAISAQMQAGTSSDTCCRSGISKFEAFRVRLKAAKRRSLAVMHSSGTWRLSYIQ